MSTAASYPLQRDIRLDFFRGIALLIIFINHIPFNELSLYTPSRFGLSDAAEIFVFLSGCTAALAYQRSFMRSSFWLGTARVLHRCGQIYTAHLRVFFALALVCVIGNGLFFEPDYISRLNLYYFFNEAQEALLGLVMLRYVPNYFDILPMYLVILLFIPLLITLSRLHTGLAVAFSLGLYLAMWLWGLELPADPRSDRPWFFNPFGWQLIFFAGFALYAGWIRPPSLNRTLLALCCLVVIIAVPISHEPTYRHLGWLAEIRAALAPWLDKTHLGPLRWLHFIALAYMAVYALKGRESWLSRGWVPALISKLGQHSLPVFQVSLVLSYIGGMVLDRAGHTFWSLLIVNMGGCGLLISTAYLLAWFKENPWKSDLPQAIGLSSAS
jgi:hypothetical protein